MNSLLQLDSDIFLAINGFNSNWLDGFMWLFSGKLVWVPMYLVIAAVLFKTWGWRRALCLLVAIGLIITVSDQMCGHWVRNTIMRLRPSNPDNPISPLVHIVNGYRGGPYGFPSCHAANSFGLAVFISLLFSRRWLTVAMLSWAIVTAWSRVVLGVHYPGDLIVGAMVGSLVAWGIWTLTLKVYNRYFTEKTPLGLTLDRGALYIIAALLLTTLTLALLPCF